VSTEAFAMPQPLVLVVDDDERAVEIATEAFNDASCAVISAREPEAAIRELRASPGVDLVYTDVKLQQKAGDISGIFLSDFIKGERPAVPVAIYSVHFREEELNSTLHKEAASDFDLILPRGGSTKVDFSAQIGECVRLATDYRNRRFDDSVKQAADSRDIWPKFSVVREFTVGSDSPSETEAVLRDNGYSLRILSLNIGDRDQSVAAWLLEFDGKFAAELYEFPHLHATGASAEDALSRLVTLIHESPEAASTNSAGDETISRLLLSRGHQPSHDPLKQDD
jgi:CheY-like chemotaxis protein